ncbi:hypothetical protein [Microvirga subterranea]|uniref:Uncharacterized protein n=1 Tax=Microvirga subterranea TaxID=186651 RepID=A0A370H3P5_9HYPH|nr:hypothetical protein [Microvirga subterranea]RDI50504.1 hypothetical protein DES45_12023 [Microvirga subterranea]
MTADLQSTTLSLLDWISLGFLSFLLSLIGLGGYRLRQEIRDAERIRQETGKEATARRTSERL